MTHRQRSEFQVIDGGIVGYSDRDVQHKVWEMSPVVTTPLCGERIGDLQVWRSGRQADGDSEHLEGDSALAEREAAPEPNQGQFVGVINELANQWAARRRLATK